MAAERIIGVDFGTSTSVIRVKQYEDGKPVGKILETKEVIFDGSGMVPTLVRKKNDDESVTYYGYEAQLKKKDCTIYDSFKVDLESEDPVKRTEARKRTEEFIRFMAKQYRDQRDHEHFGNLDDKERTIISYPVKWSDETKQFMIETAKKADFPNVTGMDEAQAAVHAVMVQSIDYLKKHDLLANGVPANVLLMDMGAGTTDLVLCRLTPDDKSSIEVLDTWPKGGDILFGGREIDSLLQNFFRNKMNAQAAQMVFCRVGTDKFKSWKEEMVSPALRENDSVSDFEVLDSCVDMMGIGMKEYCLDRAAFEDCLKDYLRQLPMLIDGCLQDAGMDGGDVDLVIVTGGHSQWYFVKEMLAGKMKQFGDIGLSKIKEEPSRIIPIARPQETVALGLAYQGITVDMPDKRKQEEEERKRKEEEERKRREEEERKAEEEYTPESDDEISGCLYLSNDGFYIDRTGKTVFHRPCPCPWGVLEVFSEGLGAVEKDDKWGYIDKTGKLVIPYQWSCTWSFSEGLASVSKDGRYDKWGYIDKTGKLVIPYQWDDAGHFSEGLASVKKDGKYGFIDKTGDLVIPCQWDYAAFFSEGLALVREDSKCGYEWDYKWGYIGQTGKLVSVCQWDDAERFSEGLARVEKDGKYGFIDKTGKLVSACQWDDAGRFSEGLACVKRDDKWGFIDKTGKLAISCQWDRADSFSEGFASIKKDNGYGYIDKTGKLAIPCQWNSAKKFSEGLACVEKPVNEKPVLSLLSRNSKGYIDKTGKLVIPYQWSSAGQFEKGVALVDKDEGLFAVTTNHYMIDKKGRIISKFF